MVGNNSSNNGCESVSIGTETVAQGYSTLVGHNAQTYGIYGGITHKQKKMVELQ
jgi:hypothetical protein